MACVRLFDFVNVVVSRFVFCVVHVSVVTVVVVRGL